jgi:diguanylate cyclase (GGDEF)-like protein
MLDIRTLFWILGVTDILLLVMMWVALGGRLRDGRGKWTASLAIQVVAFFLFALRGTIPDALSIVAANGLLPLAITLMAAAILEFHGRRLALWVHFAGIAITSMTFALLLDDFQARTVASGVIFGSALLAVTVLLYRLPSELGARTRWAMIASFLVGAAASCGRGLLSWYAPDQITSLLSPSPLQSVHFLLGYAFVVTSSFGFLLMHVDRADIAARKLATIDPLTGVYNRRTFLELAERELARCGRAGSDLSVIMIDLDNFKRVNDSFGHLTGDEALRRFVVMAQGCLRRADLVVRYGGEEFCVLLPEVKLDEAVVLAERIRDVVAKSPMVIESPIGSAIVPITISVGVAALRHADGSNIDQLLGRADAALYEAKNQGRNRVVAQTGALRALA